MRRTLLTAAVVLPLVLCAGIWLGGHPDRLPGPLRDVLVGDSEAQVYGEALDMIAENYYRKVSKRDLVDQGLKAGVESLDDRFSAYFDRDAYRAFEQASQGEFEGVGMSVAEVRRGLRVLTVYRGSPAQRGGIRSGDVVTAVDGNSIAGKTSEQATSLIKGPAGTSVRLTVRARGAKPRTIDLDRARVDIPAVESSMIESDGVKVAHVRLAGFTSGARLELRDAIDRLLKRGARGIVLDLRNNGGGLLNEAVLVASIFVPDGKIVSTRGRARAERVFQASGEAIDGKIPVVVLVNRESASASEIVAGALQDRRRAKVVGTRTFGKGVFQEVRPLANGGALDITVGEYFTPSGRNLGGGGVRRGSGVRPDIAAVDDPKTADRDEALLVAARAVARK